MSNFEKNKYFTTAIILAAGVGSRFDSTVPKQTVSLLGKSIIARAAEPFYRCDDVDCIVVVTRSEDIDFVNRELHFLGTKLHAVISGGKCRAESASLGFLAVPDCTTHVAIHDAARCLIKEEDISSVIIEAYRSGAASAVSLIASTVKRVLDNSIVETVSRDELVLAETPQVFSCDIYKKALSAVLNFEKQTDDNMMVENIGVKISPVILSFENPKITYPHDLAYAEFLQRRREKECLDLE